LPLLVDITLSRTGWVQTVCVVDQRRKTVVGTTHIVSRSPELRERRGCITKYTV
jgi:hypothetical protein